MGQITIGATASRRVLGSLNDLASLARFTMAERYTDRPYGARNRARRHAFFADQLPATIGRHAKKPQRLHGSQNFEQRQVSF